MNRDELLAKQSRGETLTSEEEAFLASSEDSTPPSTQPTNQPPAPATEEDPNKRYIAILEQTLREQNRQIQELANNRPAPAAPAPAPDPEAEKSAFYNDPVNTTRKIIQDALKESIEPLQQFVRNLKVDGSPYSQMLNRFKADPRFASALADSQILAAVEEIMSKAELSDINMQSAIVHATGLKSMGLLGTVVPSGGNGAPAPAPTPAPAPSPSSAPAVLPPHVRPSAPAAPTNNNNNQPAQRQLTESERRLMRENGFKSEAEYLKWLEMPASEVAHTNFDKPRT